jgi:hypothetical protein
VSSKLFAALSKVPAEAAAFAGAVSKDAFTHPTGRQRIAAICGVSEARWPQLELVMSTLAQHDLIELSDQGVTVRPVLRPRFVELAVQLKAVADFVELTKDDNASKLVVTYPRSPSVFANALLASGFGAHGIEDTEAALDELAKTTEQRLVFVTPFLDQSGIALLLRLLASMRVTARAILLTRRTASLDCIAIAEPFARQLDDNRCEVREFRPYEADSQRETFHAKVILRDSSAAYVGSANLTGTSMSYSLEMGSIVYGRGARTVATVVDAMIRCSEPVRW